MKRIIKHSGDLMPLLIATLISSAYLVGLDGLTWERPLSYGSTALCLLLGIWGLVVLARRPAGAYPSVMSVTFIYQKALLFVVYTLITIASIGAVYDDLYTTASQVSGVPGEILRAFLEAIYPVTQVPDLVVWSLLVGCSATVSIVNLIIFFGRNRRWLETETDPVPGRSIINALRKDNPKRKEEKRDGTT
jgi:hypothetical protein